MPEAGLGILLATDETLRFYQFKQIEMTECICLSLHHVTANSPDRLMCLETDKHGTSSVEWQVRGMGGGHK